MGAGLSIHQSREFVQKTFPHPVTPTFVFPTRLESGLRFHHCGDTRRAWTIESSRVGQQTDDLNPLRMRNFAINWTSPSSSSSSTLRGVGRTAITTCVDVFYFFPPSIEFFFLSRELASQHKQFILLAVTARGFKLSILFRCHWPEFMKILTRLLVGKLKFIFSFFQWSDALDEIRNVFQCDPARVVNHLAHIKHAIKRISPARKSSFGSVYLISRRKHNCRWINWFCGAIADKARSSSVKGRSHHKQTSFRTSNRCRRSLPSWFPISSSFVLRTLEPKKAGTERFADSQMFEQIIGRKVSAPIKMIAVRASWADTHFATTHLMKMLFISNWVYHAV